MSEDAITLSYGKLAQINEGLGALDGLRTGPDSFKPYKFDDENDTTWIIASNQAKIADALKVYDRAKKSLAVQHQMGDRVVITDVNAEKVSAFMAALAALEDKEVSVPGLEKLSRGRLKVGSGEKKNPIPPSVLAKLMPILEE